MTDGGNKIIKNNALYELNYKDLIESRKALVEKIIQSDMLSEAKVVNNLKDDLRVAGFLLKKQIFNFIENDQVSDESKKALLNVLKNLDESDLYKIISVYYNMGNHKVQALKDNRDVTNDVHLKDIKNNYSLVVKNEIPTLCAFVNSLGTKCIGYNPLFLSLLENKDLVNVLKHELFHHELGHIEFLKHERIRIEKLSKDSSEKTKEIKAINTAIDIEVNEALNIDSIKIDIKKDESIDNIKLIMVAIVFGHNIKQEDGEFVVEVKNKKNVEKELNFPLSYSTLEELIEKLQKHMA